MYICIWLGIYIHVCVFVYICIYVVCMNNLVICIVYIYIFIFHCVLVFVCIPIGVNTSECIHRCILYKYYTSTLTATTILYLHFWRETTWILHYDVMSMSKGHEVILSCIHNKKLYSMYVYGPWVCNKHLSIYLSSYFSNTVIKATSGRTVSVYRSQDV